MKFCAALMIAGLASLYTPLANACRCQDFTNPSRWTSATASAADHVFFGTVDSVTDIPGNLPHTAGTVDFGNLLATKLVHVSIAEQFKGISDGNVIMRASNCRGFALVPGDQRVFFVAEDGQPISCSQYRYGSKQFDFLTDEQVVSEMRKVYKKNKARSIQPAALAEPQQ